MADVIVNTIVDEDAATAQIIINVGGRQAVYTGSSKRHPSDMIDEKVGESLALARAMHKVTTDLLLYAENRVKQNSVVSKLWGEPFFKEPESNATSR